MMQNNLVLWTGKKHSGKTTAAAKLAQNARAEGFVVAGLLAPSTHCNGRLIGYDILDLRNKNRASLAQRKTNSNLPFAFCLFTFDFLVLPCPLQNIGCGFQLQC